MDNSLSNKAEILKAVAHPTRLAILNELLDGVKCVSDLEEFLKIRQSNVSQHLSLLRKMGLIDFFMDGRLRCYFLKNPMIPALMAVIVRDYEGTVTPPACCPVTKKGKYPGKRSN